MKNYTKEQILEIVKEYSTFSRLSGEHFGLEYVEDEYGINEEQLKIWLSNSDYYQCPYCKQIDPCPSVDDLKLIQSSLSVPEKPLIQLFDISNDCFGSVKFDCSKEQEFTLCLKGRPTEKFSLNSLEEDTPQAIETRLNIGWSMYAIYMHYALSTRDQIPDPFEALKYTVDDFNLAEYWKCWALKRPKTL